MRTNKCETVLFFPEVENRKAEGGLRTKCCFKESSESKPLISIVTVVFNGVKYLEETIKSVINQKYNNIEYIIVDGGSNDGTIDIIKKYEDKIDYWLSEEDNGIYDAMNKGLEFASGDWIYFLGSDDKLISEGIQSMFKVKRDKTSVYYGNVIMFSSKEKWGQLYTKIHTMFYNIPHQAIFYPKIYYKNAKFDLDYKSASDHIYLMNYVNSKNANWIYVDINIAEYNDCIGISSINQDIKFRKNQYKIIKSIYPMPYWIFFRFRQLIVCFLKLINIDNFLRKFYRKLFKKII
ncbi:glycosyltransferase [Aliarcobacter skirrowii]|uniref:glycosyltransferase family 2 protein n=1 Tax=Aliarcobacter skirrowii TaxID=28200 RepID=UPI000F67F152|nr:glycosyltransferase family 2 protein [Aliarcobacter skirrowii]AZL54036.1 glycosyltransferase [Aliarcobacter skirrowii]